MTQLNGKTAVITGATSGIGEARETFSGARSPYLLSLA